MSINNEGDLMPLKRATYAKLPPSIRSKDVVLSHDIPNDLTKITVSYSSNIANLQYAYRS